MSEGDQPVPSLLAPFKAPAAQFGLEFFSKSSQRHWRNSLCWQVGCSPEGHGLARFRGWTAGRRRKAWSGCWLWCRTAQQRRRRLRSTDPKNPPVDLGRRTSCTPYGSTGACPNCFC